MTFSDAYASVGPDVEAIAELLCIPAAEADKLVNSELNKVYAEKLRSAARKEYQRSWMERKRASERLARSGASS